ncbi:zinc-ribbon domain-containing protein [Patescibacteria group bacterium]|nr:zinc-ribbon domain-containing protein [Patescibacteria group bacterium]
MNCKHCNNSVPDDAKFCMKCGKEQIVPQAKVEEPVKQKSFKLDMSKEANRRGLMGIGFLILLKVLGPLVGSYLIAGIILGVLFAVIDYSAKKS